MKTEKPNKKIVTKENIRRAVASSTAIETHDTVETLEKKLKDGISTRKHVTLCD